MTENHKTIHFAPSERRKRLLDVMCGYVGPADDITTTAKDCNCQDCLDWLRPPKEDAT